MPPKPNYAFEKRQRELAKKRKKEEKALRKGAATDPMPADGDAAPAPASDAPADTPPDADAR